MISVSTSYVVALVSAAAITGVLAIFAARRRARSAAPFDLLMSASSIIVRSMSDMVVTLDAHDRIVGLNPAARWLIGLAGVPLIGQPITDVIPDWPTLAEYPVGAATVITEIGLGEGDALRSFELRISPLLDRRANVTGRVAILHEVTEHKRDIAERERSEEALRSQKQLFENLVAVAQATMAGPILEATLHNVLDVATRLTSADQGSLFLCDAAGEVTHSILARGPTTPERQRAVARLVFDQGLAGWAARERQTAVVEDTASDGRWLQLPDVPYTLRSALVVPIVSGVTLVGVLTLHHSARSHFTEEHVRLMQGAADHMTLALHNAQLYDELYQAKETAEAANRAKDEFISFVSHELKTPMTAIRGATDILLTGVAESASESQAALLNIIRSNIDMTAALVSDLADIARIEAGQLRLDHTPVTVSEVVEQVVRSARGQLEAKSQTLELAIPDDLPVVWGDRMRLCQVLGNLVSNACKYTPEGGRITISAEHPLNQAAADAMDVVHIMVRDTGIGIAPAAQRNIFEKFYRAEDEKVREMAGTGLGLNITKYLVELQGGRIWFESVFREGSTFHFTIPIAAASAPQVVEESRMIAST